MLRWLRGILRDVQVVNLPLGFHLDTDEQGRHVTRVSYTIQDETTWVRNVAALWNYGFSIEREGRRYMVSAEDQDTLLALRATASEVRPDGAIVSPVRPPVLRYLRQKSAVRESESSQAYKVLDQPFAVGVQVDYDPKIGLVAQAGYQVPGEVALVPQDQLQLTPDGGYARVGNQFIPLPKEISKHAQAWLDKGQEVIPLSQIPEFFQRDMVLFGTEFQAVLTDRAARLQVLKLPAAPTVHVQSGGGGWLDFQLSYDVGDVQLTLDEVRRAEGRTIRPDPYTFVEVAPGTTEPVRRALADLDAEKTGSGYHIPVTRFASLEEFIAEIGGQRQMDAAYREFLDDLEGFDADERFGLSPAAEQDLRQADIQLRPYQRAGIHWLTWLVDHHLHGLLADDMGLGKTIQAAAALRCALEKGPNHLPSLVICPKSVVRHWYREIKRCHPTLPVCEYVGAGRDRDVWKRTDPSVVISTYETIARDVALVAPVPLFFLVLDESTRIKNPEAKRTRAVKALNAAHRFALSGTPIENRPAELWSVFDFLMQGHLGRYATFQRAFEAPIADGDRGALARLGRRVGPFILHRRKEEVARDLPPKIEMEPDMVELTAEQRRIYVAIQHRAQPLRDSLLQGRPADQIGILAALTRLKQVCDHPALVTRKGDGREGRSEKYDLALERIGEIAGQGEQVVVFSQYLKMLDLIQAGLDRRGITWTRLDGAVDVDERQRRIDRFNDRQVTAALCSLRAVGHGVNLTAANHVIHIDRWWNPAIEDQATDRVHRIGQGRPVFVHQIMVADTLEEKIAALQERKRGVSDRVMGAAAEKQLSWTREDLLDLLKPLD